MQVSQARLHTCAAQINSLKEARDDRLKIEGVFRTMSSQKTSVERLAKTVCFDVKVVRRIVNCAVASDENPYKAVMNFYVTEGGLRTFEERLHRSDLKKLSLARGKKRELSKKKCCPVCRGLHTFVCNDMFFSTQECPVCLEQPLPTAGVCIFKCGHSVCMNCCKKI